MDELHRRIRLCASADGLSLADAQAMAVSGNLALAEVEEQALLLGIMPRRYLRNGLDCPQQLRLQRARVAVIGCGGLGGSVAEALARLGVGSLRLVDPDSFEEHNLNRQRFATVETLGKAKVEAAREALLVVNPAIRIETARAGFGERDVLAVEVVVDALDSAGRRLDLAALCRRHGRPLVHGAVRDWYGQVGIATTTNDLIADLFPRAELAAASPPGVTAPTVALVAALQAAEAGKLLLGLPSPLKGNWLSCNLLSCEYELVPSRPLAS